MWLGWIKSEINIRGMVSDEIDRNDLDVSREQKKNDDIVEKQSGEIM